MQEEFEYALIYEVQAIYSRHAHIWNGSKPFPKEQEQKLIYKLEARYFRSGIYLQKDFDFNSDYIPDVISRRVPSVAFAKMYMKYGYNPIDNESDEYALIAAVRQIAPRTTKVALYVNKERIEVSIKEYYNKYYDKTEIDMSNVDLPVDNSIALAQLYLSLGADIHHIAPQLEIIDLDTNAFIHSLRYYDSFQRFSEKPTRPIEPLPDELFAPTERTRFAKAPKRKEKYRKTKVTDFLEDFVEAESTA